MSQPSQTGIAPGALTVTTMLPVPGPWGPSRLTQYHFASAACIAKGQAYDVPMRMCMKSQGGTDVA